jgi:predicted nucleotidyltransferase
MVTSADATTAMQNEILRTVVGSGVHGLAIEGTDDHDEMGVFIEPRTLVYGTGKPLDSYTWRTQPEGARSGPGDTDLVIYSLRHYIRLAAGGNPTVLVPLFAPEESILKITPTGENLRMIRNAFLSKHAIQRFLGYMHGQHERMMGRGKQNRVPNRPELIERYGWDVKYGSHAARLAFQASEILRSGHLTLPMSEHERRLVLEIKRGEYSRENVSQFVIEMEAEIRAGMASSPLPDEPNWATIERFSIDAHEQHWFHGRNVRRTA